MKQRDLEALLADMTLKEKADQMLQVVGQMILSEDKNVITGPMQELGITEEDVRLAGSVLGSMGAADIKKIYAGRDQWLQDGISYPSGAGSYI